MSIETAHVLSTQEQAIIDGKKVLHGTVTDRVLRMFEAIRTYGPPRLTLERAIYFTESFKTTEGQPLVLRWAKALQHIAENIPVAIFDDELIVGRPNTWFGRYSLVFPELDGTIMKAGAEAFIAAKGAPDAVVVTEEDKKIIDEVLFPYWNGKDFTPNFVKALPPESRHMNFGSDPNNVGTKQTFVIINTSTMRHSQNWVIDFEKMLKRGCKGLREEAQARLAALEHPRDITFKGPFYEAAIITCDALSLFARRYSELAAQMAAKTKDPQRKQELEEIAAICAWVPENPARTFREAIQSQWFTQLFSRLEEMVGGADQLRPDGPVFLSHVQEGHRRRANHPGRCAGVVPVPLAEHHAEHRIPDVACPGQGARGILPPRDSDHRRSDPRRFRRHQRALLRSPGIDPSTSMQLPGAGGPDPRQHARQVPACRGRDHQGRQGFAQAAQRRVHGSVVHERTGS